MMIDVFWSDAELDGVGIDKRKLVRLVTMLKECSRSMSELGLSVYGEAGSGHLIHKSRPEHDKNGKADFGAIVANIGTGFDGGAW